MFSSTHLTSMDTQGFSSPTRDPSLTQPTGSSLFNSGALENGSSNGNPPQYAPSFLFGAQHASKRRNLVIPNSGSPGILKHREGNLSPGSKNVHWSPLLVKEHSVSPSLKKDGLDATATSLWNGPPLRSIREDHGPPEKQLRLEQSSTSHLTMLEDPSSACDFDRPETSLQKDKDFWVTVFGFSEDQVPFIIDLFSKHGNIVSQKSPKKGNWMHVRYSSVVHAHQALARNGKIFDSTMIGVIPCNDREVIDEEGPLIAASSSSVNAVNTSFSTSANDFLLNGSRIVPSTANTSLPNRSRFSMSSRVGMRPLNGSFTSDASGNLSMTQKNGDGSFLGKFWNYVCP